MIRKTKRMISLGEQSRRLTNRWTFERANYLISEHDVPRAEAFDRTQLVVRLLALLVMTTCFSIIPAFVCRVFLAAPGWRLLIGTLLGWATVAHYTWYFLLTEGETAWVKRKLKLLRDRFRHSAPKP